MLDFETMKVQLSVGAVEGFGAWNSDIIGLQLRR